MSFLDLDIELCLWLHQQESLWSVTVVSRTGSWSRLQRSSDEFLERPNPSQTLSLPSSWTNVQFSTLIFNSLCTHTLWPSHLIKQTKSNHWDQGYTNTHSSQQHKLNSVKVYRPGRNFGLPIYTFIKYTSYFLLFFHSISDKPDIRHDCIMQIPHYIFTSLACLFASPCSTADDNTQYTLCRPTHIHIDTDANTQ